MNNGGKWNVLIMRPVNPQEGWIITGGFTYRVLDAQLLHHIFGHWHHQEDTDPLMDCMNWPYETATITEELNIEGLSCV